MHRDFHSGNIIVDGNSSSCHITDLGLSKLADKEEAEGEIYGVMPYVAPEVLRNQPYTQKSDIYSLGMIMYEVITGIPPFGNESHDVNLALQICQGIRPKFPEQVKYPQLLIDLIRKCWDKEPNNRPTAREISGVIGEWFSEWALKEDTELFQQHQEAEQFNKTLPDEIKYPTYQSQEIWHSKPINTNEINNSLNLLGIGMENLNVQNNNKVKEEFINKNEVFLKDSEEIAPIEIQPQHINWNNTHSSFTEELIKKWQELDFTYSQTQDWINTGLKPTDANLCAWLRDNKGYTPEQVLNHSNLEQLNQEYFQWWQEQQQFHTQSHQEQSPSCLESKIEIPPKNS